jgi:hypothetical protein
MTDAVIVSTARTPIGKVYKGALNNTEGATMLGHAISAALEGEDRGAEVEDVVMGQPCSRVPPAPISRARRCSCRTGDGSRNNDRSPMRIRLGRLHWRRDP